MRKGRGIFSGKSAKKIRKIVVDFAQKRGLSFFELFQKAAEQHTPKLNPGKANQEAQRFADGYATPHFVKDFLARVLSDPSLSF